MVGAVTRVLWAGIFPAAPAVLDALEAMMNVPHNVEESGCFGLILVPASWAAAERAYHVQPF